VGDHRGHGRLAARSGDCDRTLAGGDSREERASSNPLHAERLGGAFTLCALCVPEEDFERVAALVNAHPEVAHNYARDHAFNMWFVLATAAPTDIARVIAAIEMETALTVYDFPREAEYFIDLRLAA